jgi:hypothetical protein
MSQGFKSASQMGELGWQPVYSRIILSVIKYWHRLENSDGSSLLANALRVQENLQRLEIDNLLDTINIIFRNLGVNIPLRVIKNYSEYTLTKVVKSHIKNTISAEWEMQINKQPKLRTYKTFKNIFKFEPYLLQVKSKVQRINLSKFRTSNHMLKIESDRYKQIPETERICQQCNQNDIENEIHFLMSCPKYVMKRKPVLESIYNKFPNTKNLCTEQLFIWILSAEDPVVNKKLAKFITYSMKCRGNS